MNSKSKSLLVVTTIALCITIAMGLTYFLNDKRLTQQFVDTNRQLVKAERSINQHQKKLIEANRRVAKLQSKLGNAKSEKAKLQSHLDYGESRPMEMNPNLGVLRFSRDQEPEILTTERHSYELTKFHTTSLIYGKHPGSKGSSYLELFDNALILVSATGIFGYVDLVSLNQDNFDMTAIDSNITEIVGYEDFFRASKVGIKDVLVLGNWIYVSFSNQLKPDCFNTSILVAEMNFNKLTFTKFFEPLDCVKRKNSYREFNAFHSGGRMVPYKGKKMLFTHGEYKYRDHAQNLDSPFGKLIAIDLETAEYQVVAMGLRDPQGLHYSTKEDTIYITDHGPQGGDEINVINNPGTGVANFGWPISSYGEHYGFKKRDYKNSKYQKAPLYKSHRAHGFIEPLIYFVPSIAISEIEPIPKEFDGVESKQFLVGSMGSNPSEGDMALHLVEFDKKDDVTNRYVIPLNERVRDIVYSTKLNKVILFLETSPAIGILETLTRPSHTRYGRDSSAVTSRP